MSDVRDKAEALAREIARRHPRLQEVYSFQNDEYIWVCTRCRKAAVDPVKFTRWECEL